MRDFFIKLLSLKGSFKWACKQMSKGLTVRPRSASGAVTYRVDSEQQQRILWAFKRVPSAADYENANMFLADFNKTDWVIFDTGV